MAEWSRSQQAVHLLPDLRLLPIHVATYQTIQDGGNDPPHEFIQTAPNNRSVLCCRRNRTKPNLGAPLAVSDVDIRGDDIEDHVLVVRDVGATEQPAGANEERAVVETDVPSRRPPACHQVAFWAIYRPPQGCR